MGIKMKKIVLLIASLMALGLMSQRSVASERPDLSDITMEIIRAEDAREITHEIELPEALRRKEEHRENDDKERDGRENDEKSEERDESRESESGERDERDEVDEVESPDERDGTDEHDEPDSPDSPDEHEGDKS